MNINTNKLEVSVVCGILAGVFSQIFGEWSQDLFALIIFMGVDFVTGILVAILFRKSPKSKNGGLSSKTCWRGIAKKVVTLLMVAVAHQADIILDAGYLRNAVVIAFCASETISIMENASAMGVLPAPVQKIMDKILDMFNNKGGGLSG